MSVLGSIPCIDPAKAMISDTVKSVVTYWDRVSTDLVIVPISEESTFLAMAPSTKRWFAAR